MQNLAYNVSKQKYRQICDLRDSILNGIQYQECDIEQLSQWLAICNQIDYNDEPYARSLLFGFGWEAIQLAKDYFNGKYQ
jgi:hypothetical protein